MKCSFCKRECNLTVRDGIGALRNSCWDCYNESATHISVVWKKSRKRGTEKLIESKLEDFIEDEIGNFISGR